MVDYCHFTPSPFFLQNPLFTLRSSPEGEDKSEVLERLLLYAHTWNGSVIWCYKQKAVTDRLEQCGDDIDYFGN
jgi:hypothetical protein